MSALEQRDDDAFVRVMKDVIGEPEMTHELAAQEAIADFRSEQQAERMGIYERL